MVHDEQIGAGGDGRIDGAQRASTATANAARDRVLDLHAVHRARIVGYFARAQASVSRCRATSASNGWAGTCIDYGVACEWIEAPRGELGAHRIDGVRAPRPGCATERRVDHERDDVALGSEPDDARLECACAHLARDGEEGVRQVDDDARDRDFGGDAVLVGVRADDERLLRFARRLEDAEPRRVGVLEDDVGAAADLGECLLLPALTSSQLPMYDVSTATFGFDRLRAAR